MFYSRTFVVAALALVAMGCREKKQSDIAPAGEAKVSSAAPAPAPAAGDTIWIGHVGSMSGNDAAFGQATDNGAKLAISEQNAKNGIKGKKVALKTLDDQGKPEEAAVAASRLITQDHVSVLIGEVASSRSLAMAPIADQNLLPMISEGSTNPRVTKDGDKTRPYVFRVCYIEPFQGTVMAKFVRENLKLTKVAILRDVGNDYAVGLAQYFKTTFQKLGGEIILEQSFKSGETDFKAQLTAIKGKNPDLIYLPGYYGEVALIARQARELGMKQPFAGGDGWDAAPLYQIAKGALDGSYFSTHFSTEDPSPVVQDFIAKYSKTYGNTPEVLAALGYDAAKVAIDALERAKELTGPSIREAMEQTKDFKTVTGSITIDADHNPVKSSMVLTVKENKPKYVATVDP
ncbi:ABC transporter substrate-binding protein [Pendulispora albinea]|uniref:ABC transporter substrate-binding protein n=1 Tax=Pendulispora albinea TaxID=2741071 RepID=A0ABZ2LPV4_9BACT